MNRWALGCVVLAAACGAAPGDPQLPPTGAAELERWLAAGHHTKWKCEPGPRDPLASSPHGKNRVCSNARLSAAGAGEYPVDSASVKELYDSGGTKVTGHAVSRHVQAGTTGESWYWFEKLGASVVADGTNLAGCGGCHSAAGSDPQHPGHDFVYVQVK